MGVLSSPDCSRRGSSSIQYLVGVVRGHAGQLAHLPQQVLASWVEQLQYALHLVALQGAQQAQQAQRMGSACASCGDRRSMRQQIT